MRQKEKVLFKRKERKGGAQSDPFGKSRRFARSLGSLACS